MLKVKKECTIEDFKFYEISDASKEEARAIASYLHAYNPSDSRFSNQASSIMESLEGLHLY